MTEERVEAARRAIAKWIRIQKMDPDNPDYKNPDFADAYLAQLIREEFEMMACQDYLAAAWAATKEGRGADGPWVTG